MGYFQENRGGGKGGKKYGKKRSFGEERSFGRGDGAKPMMHSAICSECNKECEVPFKPTGVRPVFCRDCFRNQEEGNPREFNNRNDRNPKFSKKSPMRQGGSNEQFEILNAKLDKILDLLDAR